MSGRMRSGEGPRNRTFAALRQEVVLRDDGRYLIYYSLPLDESGAARGAARQASTPPPEQRPWSPDREPDV